MIKRKKVTRRRLTPRKKPEPLYMITWCNYWSGIYSISALFAADLMAEIEVEWEEWQDDEAENFDDDDYSGIVSSPTLAWIKEELERDDKCVLEFGANTATIMTATPGVLKQLKAHYH